MNISSVGTAMVADSISRMNDLLMTATDAQIGFSEKMLKSGITEQVQSASQNSIDTYA